MAWDVKFHADLRIVETSYSGDLAPAELRGAVQETMRLSHDHDTTLLLSDCTKLSGGHSFIHLFAIVTDLITQGVAFSIKEAILLPTESSAEEKVNFWHTICYNRGIKVETFRDRKSAIEWLVE